MSAPVFARARGAAGQMGPLSVPVAGVAGVTSLAVRASAPVRSLDAPPRLLA